MTIDERKQRILSAVVHEYVETVKPVGSEDLATRHAWGVKSATIRNEMAELSELGYLKQPHTSSGRVPSDQGYRFYVDHLMVARRHEASQDQMLDMGRRAIEVDALLRETCSLLSRATSYASVATRPQASTAFVTYMFAARAGEDRVLLTAVLNTGQVLNRLATGLGSISLDQMDGLCAILREQFCGKELPPQASWSDAALRSVQDKPAHVRSALAVLQQAANDMLGDAVFGGNSVVGGTIEILRQPEFRDIARFEAVMNVLEHNNELLRTSVTRSASAGVAVVIGSENEVPGLQECTVITAQYSAGASAHGHIGVLGPTRMDYDSTVPMVQFFARSLTSILCRMGA